MLISSQAERAISEASRPDLEKLLASYGYQVYDHETDDELRECIRKDVASGVMDADDLFVPADTLRDCRDR